MAPFFYNKVSCILDNELIAETAWENEERA